MPFLREVPDDRDRVRYVFHRVLGLYKVLDFLNLIGLHRSSNLLIREIASAVSFMRSLRIHTLAALGL